MIRYLTIQEVLYLHQRVIERTGGSPGVRDAVLLEAALNRPRAVFGGAEVYPTLALKGAVLIYSLVSNHLFVDGNKRMGLQCLDLFLRLNGSRLTAAPEARCQFLSDVAADALSLEEIGGWIDANSGAARQTASRSLRPRARTTRRLALTNPSPTAAPNPE